MKKIGFLICDVGNGHLTQAITIYNILKNNNFVVPIVISCGLLENLEYKKIFYESDYDFEKIWLGEKETNSFSLLAKINFIRSIMKKMDSEKFIKKYQLDMIISFWTPNLRTTFSVPCISISPQFLINNNLNLNLVIRSCQNKQVPVSVGEKNIYSKYWIPYLIDINPVKKIKTNKKIALAYAVSGIDFQKRLFQIAKNNSDYEIHFFFNTKPFINFPSNVIYHKTSRTEFKKYFAKANCVLCTSGNELIQECIINKIPVATMNCSKKQFEQVENMKKYVYKLKYAEKMENNLNLDLLSKKDLSLSNKHFLKSLENREQKIIKLINSFL